MYGQNTVTVSWADNRTMVSQDIPGLGEAFKESTVALSSPPQPIYIQGKIKGTNQTVMLNGQAMYPAIATETQKTIQITLGEGK